MSARNPDKLDPTPGPRCGEPAGERAHRRRNERSCKPCRLASQEAENVRRRARRAGVMAAPRETWDYAGPKPSAKEAFIAEIEYLIQCGEGWGAICAKFRVKPQSLERRLMKHNRNDLADKIFGDVRWEVTQGERYARYREQAAA